MTALTGYKYHSSISVFFSLPEPKKPAFPFTHTPSSPLRIILTVSRTPTFVLIATERECGLALWLSHFAGQINKGFDECATVYHRHFKQTDLLISRPILGIGGVNSPLVWLVQFISQHNDCHLWVNITALNSHRQYHLTATNLFMLSPPSCLFDDQYPS